MCGHQKGLQSRCFQNPNRSDKCNRKHRWNSPFQTRKMPRQQRAALISGVRSASSQPGQDVKCGSEAEALCDQEAQHPQWGLVPICSSSRWGWGTKSRGGTLGTEPLNTHTRLPARRGACGPLLLAAVTDVPSRSHSPHHSDAAVQQIAFGVPVRSAWCLCLLGRPL